MPQFVNHSFSELFSRRLQVLGFSGALRHWNPHRRLPLVLLALLGALVWSCSPASAGALLARQAVIPGQAGALSSGRRRHRLAETLVQCTGTCDCWMDRCLLRTYLVASCQRFHFFCRSPPTEEHRIWWCICSLHIATDKRFERRGSHSGAGGFTQPAGWRRSGRTSHSADGCSGRRASEYARDTRPSPAPHTILIKLKAGDLL